MGDLVDRIDAVQRRHRVAGFPLAVVYKYFDDQGPYLAAILTYYTFVAIFPMMLIASSVLGFVLQGDETCRKSCSPRRSASSPSSGRSSRSPRD